MSPRRRIWFGLCQFAGLRAFHLGNVEAESEMEAELALLALWREMIPCDPPRMIQCIPGHILAHPDEREPA